MALILKMCLAVLLAVLVSNFDFSVDSATVMKREIQTSTESRTEPQSKTGTTEKPVKMCDALACGWAVYTAFTRHINYFMKNACECQHHQHCIRVDDDPVVSAYVYKCRDKPTPLPPTPQTPQ